MILLGSPPSPWNADGAAVLKQFLTSKIGRQALLQLVDRRPPLSVLPSAEQMALRSSAVAGYELALNTLLSLTEPPDDKGNQPVITYPDLDDDSLWPEPPKREEAPAPPPKPRERPAQPENIPSIGKPK